MKLTSLPGLSARRVWDGRDLRMERVFDWLTDYDGLWLWIERRFPSSLMFDARTWDLEGKISSIAWDFQ